MEYEIEDDALLFDDSTNPSLFGRLARQAARHPLPADRRRWQKAEVIPDEEDQAA